MMGGSHQDKTNDAKERRERLISAWLWNHNYILVHDPPTPDHKLIPVLYCLWGGWGPKFGHQDSDNIEQKDKVDLEQKAD